MKKNINIVIMSSYPNLNLINDSDIDIGIIIEDFNNLTFEK